MRYVLKLNHIIIVIITIIIIISISIILMCIRRVVSQFFLVSPRDHFVCPVPSFSEMKEIG